MLLMITLKEIIEGNVSSLLHQTPAPVLTLLVKEATERRIRVLRKNLHNEHTNSKHGRASRAGRLCAHLIIIAREMRVGIKLNENIWGDAEARYQYL